MNVIHEGNLSPWPKRGHRTVALDTSYMTACMQSFLHPGTRESYVFSQFDIGNFVTVFALTEAGNVILTRQWKQGVEAICLQCAGGRLGHGKTCCEVADRKLRSETGYRAKLIEIISPALHVMDSQSPNLYHIALATNCHHVGRKKSSEAAVIEVLELEPAEFWEMLHGGSIQAPDVYVAAMMALKKGYLPFWD